ncbi:MAG: tol-pal system protein YbgF [Candidatus Solibacter usitatus]|nr:tol-pal system protein YbgF [Candidatus Solibacter usitatus]
MKFRRLCLIAIFVLPAALSAASREIQELQRDVAQLQQDLKTLQRAFDEKIPSLAVLVQQALDLSRETNKTLISLDGRLQEQFRQQSKEVVAPIAGYGAKIDQLSGDFSQVRESMADVTTRMGKLEQQIIDLSNAVKTMQAPAAPPPPAGGQTAPTASSPAPPPAGELYENARRDMLGGKSDLALQGFAEYLKYYPNGPYAPNAQFYIGEIHGKQGDYETALRDFNMVLEKYPANNKTADALYVKGLTLVKMGKRTAGAAEFRQVIKDFPHTEQATKAQAQLKNLGLSAGTPTRRK